MRVGTAFRYDGFSSAIRATDARVQETQRRVTSGERIAKPSDDPTGTRGLLGIGGLRSGIAAYTRNLDVAKNALTGAEAAYGDLGDLAQSARTLAIQGATTAMDASGLEAIADQISTIQERLVSLGNSQGPDGRYLFGGRRTDAKPFSVGPDGALGYSGDTVPPTMETGPGETARVGETGGDVDTLYARLDRLKESLRSGDVSTISNVRLGEIDDSADTLSAARADVGRRMNGIEATRATHERREAELSERADDLGGVDYATAIVDYTAAQTAYQAALQVATKGFSTGLMDFIR